MAGAKLVYNHLSAIAKDTQERLGQVVRKIAFDLEAQAKARAPVDTGALAASIHTVTDRDDGRSAALSAAKALNAGAQFTPATPKPAELHAFVAVGADYGFWVEIGTTRMAAQPYLLPAVEVVRGPFLQACAVAIRQGARAK